MKTHITREDIQVLVSWMFVCALTAAAIIIPLLLLGTLDRWIR